MILYSDHVSCAKNIRTSTAEKFTETMGRAQSLRLTGLVDYPYGRRRFPDIGGPDNRDLIEYNHINFMD